MNNKLVFITLVCYSGCHYLMVSMKEGTRVRSPAYIQGDPSRSSKPIIDIDVKVAFYYKDILLKRNFHINDDRF